MSTVNMGTGKDPRLNELRRLQQALDIAAKHLDGFESRVSRSLQQTRDRPASEKFEAAENNFASRIVAGMAKFRQVR
jgi:hypothetical protein